MGAASARAADRDPDLLAVGVGVYDQSWIDPPAFFQVDADTPHDRTQFVTAEYRFGWSPLKVGDWFAVKPLVGVLTTFKGSVYTYGGFGADFRYGHLFITPSVAAGYYAHGDGKDMGYPLEFRTQIETGWRFDNGDRFSFALSHISNAELGKTVTIPGTPRTRTVNPGANNLVAYYSFAL
ncbi:MAG: acyloxyacyl hydrolase [Azospirillaceae bacterium]|nr:acyloxyacyl hydrolase [Azospirillaceae bacterium]